ncbi:aldo/keto reductase [Erythrobacter sp. 3-20A1M]|uniref:aldo/keto reductase n=1 Tax=Erythrobacter sp. 3-20A1M TaxID=2653850 RepID=UPI001BFC6653|nr:aldo/keto reductase [Erythrobacter sp. 3-20A1M]QWC57456.1 aldo/keto reductase [Erythrobacter sp. 3-20A1M]
MILEETYTLNNGVTIPKIGFGTWLIDDGEVEAAVGHALDVGYRHIDTAQAYENERGVGAAIRSSTIARDDIFVTSKLAAEVKSLEEARTAIDGSLKEMGLDTIDLMIIHSPQPWANFREGDHFFEGNLEAWRALEEALQAGKLRAIGVSNFEQVDLDNILENGSVKPAVNQFLAHIGNTPHELIKYTHGRGVQVEAYSPFGHGEILGNDTAKQIAANYDASVSQLAIRYCLQLGLLPLPKSTTPDHIRANTQVDFTISDTDMATLRALAFHDYGEASDFPVYAKKARAS